MHIDFNGSGDPLNSADDHISAECILGLRLAARNIFHCDLIKLQQHLPVQHQHWFTLRDVTTYLATQKRKSLGLGSDAILLQVITVDELQLVSGQSVERLQKNSRGLVNVLIGCLAAWMISGKWHAHQLEASLTAPQASFLLCACHSLLLLVLSPAAVALVLVRLSVVSAGCCAHHGSHL